MTKTTPSEIGSQEENDLALRAATESAALTLLFERYYPLLHKYTFYRTGDAQSADDLTSLIFEKILGALAHFKPQKSPFRAWLFGIARHTLVDHLRRFKRERPLLNQIPPDLAAEDIPPEERMVQNEAEQQLLQALKQLGGRDQDLLALKFSSELTNREIAKICQLNETHVGVLLYRALKQLRQCLTTMEEPHEYK